MIYNELKVCHTMYDIKNVVDKHKNSTICLYVADKTPKQWAESTSSVYMNSIDANILYLPVNVKKDDDEMLRNIYEFSLNNKQIVCINHTHPHKSNRVLRHLLDIGEGEFNADVVFKDGDRFVPVDCNGPAFMEFYRNDVGEFTNKNVVILGVGGAGEIIARLISVCKPNCLYLVDIVDKNKLAIDLNKNVTTKYYDNIGKVSVDNNSIVVINCTGLDDNGSLNLNEFLKNHSSNDNIFVDIRANITQAVLNASKYNWHSYTGFGMNYNNGYRILSKLCDFADIEPPSLEMFKKLVLSVTRN